MFPANRTDPGDMDVCHMEEVPSLYANCGAVASAVKGNIGECKDVTQSI